jgi:hypothetical protein
MYAVLLIVFGRLRFELGRGQKTEEKDCKQEDKDINRNVVVCRRVKAFHLYVGRDVTT